MAIEDVRQGHQNVLRELNEERVAALNRISRTLESLIADLHARRDRLRSLEGDERAAALAEYRDVRARAAKYRWYLDVQREALGLRPHHTVDEVYRIPSRDGATD